MQVKKQYTYRLTPDVDKWITEQAEQNGISKNDVVQMALKMQINKSKPAISA